MSLTGFDLSCAALPRRSISQAGLPQGMQLQPQHVANILWVRLFGCQCMDCGGFESCHG